MANLIDTVFTFGPKNLIILKGVSAKLQAIKDDLNELYPERRGLIDQLILGIVSRNHVLQWGPPGTAKTHVARTLFRCIKGPIVWDATVSGYTTEADIFGIPDFNEMRQNSRIVRNPIGTILQAHYALVDEWGDMGVHLMRGKFLRFMNEREYTSEGNAIRTPLEMMVATTNANPADLVREEPQKLAALERFLLKCKVGQMVGKENEERMVNHHLHGRQPSATIQFSELFDFASIVQKFCLFNDATMVSTYVEVVNAYEAKVRKKNGGCVSNREMAHLTQIVEAYALLYGRTEVDLDDILHGLPLGLCDVGIPEELDAFQKVAEPIITEALKNRKQPLGEVQLKLIGQYSNQVVTATSSMSAQELQNTLQGLHKLRKNVDQIKPETRSVEQEKTALLTKIDGAISRTVNVIAGGAV